MSRRRRYTTFVRTTNPHQALDSGRAWVRAGAALSVAGVAAAAFSVAPAQAAAPDVACQKAGVKTLQGAGLLSSVAKNGISVDTAVSLGVTVREGADISGVPDPIPLSLLIADHRAGDDSLFVYPWCG